MKTVGIITEYNPLHQGHIIHMNKSRAVTGADIVVCVMSGDFVQRGEPAIIDKYSRTQMAIRSGVDLVAELPAESCLSSAEGFAEGAVNTLAALKVPSLCFGCETPDISKLSHAADILLDEPEDFKKRITSLTSGGMSYAAARQQAFAEIAGEEAAEVLSGSNNILAIEYIKAIKRRRQGIESFCIKREGADYNDSEIREDEVSSATAVRKAILAGTDVKNAYMKYLPTATEEILNGCLHYPIEFNDCSAMFFYRMETLVHQSLYSKERFADILTEYEDVSKEISDRIYNEYLKDAVSDGIISLEEFAARVKTRQYTMSRIKRIFMRIMLNIRKRGVCKANDYGTYGNADGERQIMSENYGECTNDCKYIRILGLSKAGREYLASVKDELSVPVISTVSDHKELYQKQIHVHNIYRQICMSKFGSAPVSDYVYRPFLV